MITLFTNNKPDYYETTGFHLYVGPVRSRIVVLIPRIIGVILQTTNVLSS